MNDGDFSEPAIDVQQVLLNLLVKELKRTYDNVDEHLPVSGNSNDPDNFLRILIRWYDNSPLARILFAPDYLIVELGPRRAEGWKRVVRIRYQDPRSIDRILRLVEQAEP